MLLRHQWFTMFASIFLCFVCLTITGQALTITEPKVKQVTNESDTRLEIVCIEDPKSYCQNKREGLKFSDGCRECQCRSGDAFCKTAECVVSVSLDTDPEKYCSMILRNNMNSPMESEQPPVLEQSYNDTTVNGTEPEFKNIIGSMLDHHEKPHGNMPLPRNPVIHKPPSFMPHMGPPPKFGFGPNGRERHGPFKVFDDYHGMLQHIPMDDMWRDREHDQDHKRMKNQMKEFQPTPERHAEHELLRNADEHLVKPDGDGEVSPHAPESYENKEAIDERHHLDKEKQESLNSDENSDRKRKRDRGALFSLDFLKKNTTDETNSDKSSNPLHKLMSMIKKFGAADKNREQQKEPDHHKKVEEKFPEHDFEKKERNEPFMYHYGPAEMKPFWLPGKNSVGGPHAEPLMPPHPWLGPERRFDDWYDRPHYPIKEKGFDHYPAPELEMFHNRMEHDKRSNGFEFHRYKESDHEPFHLGREPRMAGPFYGNERRLDHGYPHDEKPHDVHQFKHDIPIPHDNADKAVASGVSGNAEQNKDEDIVKQDAERQHDREGKAAAPSDTLLLSSQFIRSPYSPNAPKNILSTSDEFNGAGPGYPNPGSQFMLDSKGMTLQHLLHKMQSLQQEVDAYRARYKTCEIYRKRMRDALKSQLKEHENVAATSQTSILAMATPMIYGLYMLL